MSRHGPVETAFLGVHRLLARDEADPVASGWSGCRVGIALKLESAALSRRTSILRT